MAKLHVCHMTTSDDSLFVLVDETTDSGTITSRGITVKVGSTVSKPLIDVIQNIFNRLEMVEGAIRS